MATITEDYVSYEVAKLLKEKGFHEKVNHVYHYYTSAPFYQRHLRDFNGEDYKNLRHEYYSAPTLQMAMKWFLKKYNIFICILFLEEYNGFGYTIENTLKKKYIATSENSSYKEPEEACEAAIKYCLENLI